MASESDISIDRVHYDRITETATNVDHLIKAVDKLVINVDELKRGLSECLPLQKDVFLLREDVDKLQIESSNLKGKLAVIVIVFGVIASWIGNIIPSMIGSR